MWQMCQHPWGWRTQPLFQLTEARWWESRGFCENTGQWHQRCPRESPDRAGWLQGAGHVSEVPGQQEPPGSQGMDQHPCPLMDVQRFSLPGGGEAKPGLGQVSTDVRKRGVQVCNADSVRMLWCQLPWRACASKHPVGVWNTDQHQQT